MGRPAGSSDYGPDVRAKICERLAAGESLQRICRSEGMPGASRVLDWVESDKEFAECYTRARLLGYRFMAEDILAISDDGENDTYDDAEGIKRTDHEVVARSRLRVDTRKWILAKMLPKIYGDKLELSGDPDRPLVVLVAGDELKKAIRGG